MRPAAGRDLDEQATYLAAHRNLEAALQFYRAAEETFRLLATHPEIGRVAPCRTPLLGNVRMLALKDFPKQLVFYRPLAGGIEILRILHGARDLESLLDEI